MVDNDVVDIADFGKIKDVSIVNEWCRALFEGVQEFPELRKNQLFTGSCQAQYGIWHSKKTEWYVQKYIDAGRSRSDGEYWAKKYIKKPKVTERWAHSSQREFVSGIAVNEKYTATKKGVDALQCGLKRSVDLKFHPPGCDTLKSIVDHELGHQIDDLLALHKDQEVIKLFKTLRDRRDGVTYKNIFAAFSNIQFYDYTKIPGRKVKDIPNYHLTFSEADGNALETLNAIRAGMNVATVFGIKKNSPMPEIWNGLPVFNGDDSDLRFLDPKGVVVGLYAKG